MALTAAVGVRKVKAVMTPRPMIRFTVGIMISPSFVANALFLRMANPAGGGGAQLQY